MKIQSNLEIHFHQQQEGSVFLENTASGEDEKFGEALLFSLFTIRSMVNLGRNEIGYSLGRVLNHMCVDFDDFKKFLSGPAQDEAHLVEYKGAKGRKYFVAKLIFEDEKFNFIYKAKGFGLMARGMGYYAPNSVLLLLRYLSNKRKEDVDFVKRLASIALKCGSMFMANLIDVRNQAQIAIKVTTENMDSEFPIDDIYPE